MTSKRERLKGVAVRDLPLPEVDDMVQWYTGDDVPISDDPKILRKFRKKILRQNFQRGAITKAEYKRRLEQL